MGILREKTAFVKVSDLFGSLRYSYFAQQNARKIQKKKVDKFLSSGRLSVFFIVLLQLILRTYIENFEKGKSIYTLR